MSMQRSPSQQGLREYKKRSRWMLIAICIFCIGGCFLVSIIFVRVRNDKPFLTFPFGTDALSFDRSGKLILAVHDGILDVRDLEKGHQIAQVRDKPDEITTLAVDAKGYNRKLLMVE